MNKLSLLLFLLSSAVAAAHNEEIRSESLIGKWECGPTAMLDGETEVTETSTTTYSKDGTFEMDRKVTIRGVDGSMVRIRDRSRGTWSLKGAIIETRVARVELLSSDSPRFTIEEGQRFADDQLREDNRFKTKILAVGAKLVIFPLESKYKGSEVATTCRRPG